MIRKRGLLLGPLVLVALVGASLSGSAIARGGGHGGGSGDSSMNPFTGDSYAYFNGGHNRGEQSIVVPWSAPTTQSVHSSDRRVESGTAKPLTPTTNGRTGRFESLDARRGDQPTDAQRQDTR